MALTIGDVDLARLDACDCFRQPGAALLELGRSLRKCGGTVVELLRHLIELCEPRLLLADVARASRELGFLERELRGTLAEPLLAGRVPCGGLVQFLRSRSLRTFLRLCGSDAGREFRFCLCDALALGFEIARARLELGRARVELPQRCAVHAFLVGELSCPRLDLDLILCEQLRLSLLRLERGARARDPLAAFLELGAEHA